MRLASSTMPVYKKHAINYYSVNKCMNEEDIA